MDKGHSKDMHTILGPGTYFEGAIKVPHNLHIEGNFKGQIESLESVQIAESGVVEANIKAKCAIIGGKLIGNLFAEDRVELEGKSSLIGDLKTKDLIIKEGAVFHGNCSMNNEKHEKV